MLRNGSCSTTNSQTHPLLGTVKIDRYVLTKHSYLSRKLGWHLILLPFYLKLAALPPFGVFRPLLSLHEDSYLYM
jgi:hypothetical protein